MATNESDSTLRGKPANDSIDELIDGLPADPILPKKRARSMDQAGPPSSQNRRAEDRPIAHEPIDKPRQSSLTGTSFPDANATRQKIVVGVVMMLAVLGIYAVVRALTKKPVSQNMQNTINSAMPIATQAAAPLPSADVAPPMSATAVAPALPAASTIAPRHVHFHADAHAVPSSNAAQPAASSRSANFSGL